MIMNTNFSIHIFTFLSFSIISFDKNSSDNNENEYKLSTHYDDEII